MEMLLDKKLIQAIFSSSKLVIKQQRHLSKSTTHLAQELPTNVQGSGGSRSFIKRREPWRWVVCSWPSDVDNEQMAAITESDPLRTTQEVAKELNVDHSMAIRHLKQIGKVKKLLKWLPHELTENKKKKSSSWSVIFSYSMQQQCGISQLDCDMWSKVDFIWKQVQCLDRESAPKHFPKPNLQQQKRSWSLFGGLLPVWSTTAFWISAKTLDLRSILRKSMRCTENCNACSWHWSTEWFQFFMTTPNCTLYNQHFKSWTNWVTKFCFICHIHLTSRQLITTSSSISTAFCRENDSTTRRRQKMLSKNLSNPKAQMFMLD